MKGHPITAVTSNEQKYPKRFYATNVINLITPQDKKMYYFSIVKKIFLFALTISILNSCGVTPKRLAKYCALCPSNNTKETYDSLVPKQKFIELPSDNSTAQLSIKCPDGQQPIVKELTNKGSKRISPHKFDFRNNVLTIMTYADSAKIAFDFFERYIIKRETKDRIPIPKEKSRYRELVDLIVFIIAMFAAILALMTLINWQKDKRKGSA